jgi:hypothetical protein
MAVIAEALGWWVVLAVLELLFIGPVDRNELLLAAGGAGTASVAAIVGRRATGRRYPVAPADLRPLLRVPATLVPETAQLTRLVLSRQRPIGHWRHRRPPERVESGPNQTVAAAAWTVGQSATPRAFVAAVEENEARVHVLRRRADM